MKVTNGISTTQNDQKNQNHRNRIDKLVLPRLRRFVGTVCKARRKAGQSKRRDEVAAFLQVYLAIDIDGKWWTSGYLGSMMFSPLI